MANSESCARKADRNHPVGKLHLDDNDMEGISDLKRGLWLCGGSSRQSEREHPYARGSSDHLVGAGPCSCPGFGQPKGVAPTIHLFNSEIRNPSRDGYLVGDAVRRSDWLLLTEGEEGVIIKEKEGDMARP